LNGYDHDGSKVAPDVHKEQVIKDKALRWLKNRLPEVPLLMWVSFQAPHEPFDYDRIYSDHFTDVRHPELRRLEGRSMQVYG
jgi:hypothetical protein